jgi:hypothetical protein
VICVLPSLAAVAAACGGGEQASAPTLAEPLAERLAAQSEAVAASVDLGDGCTAQRQLGELERASERAIAAGRIDAALQGELRATLRALRAGIDCDPAPAPASAPPPPTTAIEEPANAEAEVEDEDDEGKGKGKDKKKGKAKGKGKHHGREGED